MFYNASMDLVSNFVGEISKAQFGGNQGEITSNIDFNDNTFSNILEKQMRNSIDTNTNMQLGNLGIPSGIDVYDLVSNTSSSATNKEYSITSADHSMFEKFNNSKDYTTSEVLAFFPSLFKSKATLTETTTNGLFDFERKVAANSYSKYARNVVTNLGEFVSDALR